MKLAALQLMQQKASKMEHPTSLENGETPSESKSEDPPGPEAGSEEEGSSASGLAKVKELAETIASDDGTGGTVVPSGWVALGCGVGADLVGVCVWAHLPELPPTPKMEWGCVPAGYLHSRPPEQGGDP